LAIALFMAFLGFIERENRGRYQKIAATRVEVT
jgi:hypothetical protein